jgi:hypothetical protein
MRVPYGLKKEYFKHSLFLVFCNRLTTSAVSAAALLVTLIKSCLVVYIHTYLNTLKEA